MIIYNEYQNYKHKKRFKAIKLITKEVIELQKRRFRYIIKKKFQKKLWTKKVIFKKLKKFKKRIWKRITFKTILVLYLFFSILRRDSIDLDIKNKKSIIYKKKFLPFPLAYEHYFIFFCNICLKDYYVNIINMYYILFEFFIYKFEHYNLSVLIFSRYTRLLKGYEKRTFFHSFLKNYILFKTVLRMPIKFLVFKLIFLFYELDSALFWDLYTPFQNMIMWTFRKLDSDISELEKILTRMLSDLEFRYLMEKKYRHFKRYKFKWFKRICDWLETILVISEWKEQEYYNFYSLTFYNIFKNYEIFEYLPIFSLNCWYIFDILHYCGDKVEVLTEVDLIRPKKEFFFDHSHASSFNKKLIGYPYREIYLPTHYDQTAYVKHWERYSHIKCGLDPMQMKRKISYKEKIRAFIFMKEVIEYYVFINENPGFENIFNDANKPTTLDNLALFKKRMKKLRNMAKKTRSSNYIFDKYL